MHPSLSSEFVFAFVSSCYDAGLTKEAAAELLQFESIRLHDNHNPGFLEGYVAVAGAPALHAVDFEKSAGPLARLGRIAKGVGSLAGEGLGLVGDAVKSVGRAGTRFIGPARPRTAGGPKIPSFVQRHPVSSFIGGTATAGGLSYGLHQLAKDESGGGVPSVPYLPPGGYDPTEAAKSYDTQLDAHSRGIADVNKRFNQSNDRRKVLADAVARGDAGSQMAAAELAALDRERSTAEGQRTRFIGDLDRTGAATEKKLQQLQQRRNKLESAKTSWSGLPRRMWYNFNGNGMDADTEINNEIERAQSGIAGATTNARLINDQRRRATNGYVGTSARRDNKQIQRDFFPTN